MRKSDCYYYGVFLLIFYFFMSKWYFSFCVVIYPICIFVPFTCLPVESVLLKALVYLRYFLPVLLGVEGGLGEEDRVFCRLYLEGLPEGIVQEGLGTVPVVHQAPLHHPTHPHLVPHRPQLRPQVGSRQARRTILCIRFHFII